MRVTRFPANRTMLAPPPRLRPLPRRHQRGAIAVLFAVLVLLLITFMGLAIDLGRLYNRKVELQSAADAAALAAAERLIGTDLGIDAAVTAAATAAAAKRYSYEQSTFTWSDSALKFSTAPTGGVWMDASAAKASPEAIMFVKVDTFELGAHARTIDNFLMKMVSSDLATSSTSAVAVAGRSTINVTPLAVCAMSSTPAAPRAPSAELVQYGFRRGVGYNLMELNPDGPSAKNFVVNPIDPASAGASANNTTATIVGPFVCAGNMPMLRVAKGQISVSHPFPLASLFEQLNSRFDLYNGGLCSYRSAPPDANIKHFLYGASNSWMLATPAGQTATSLTDAGKLMTVADPSPLPGTNTAAAYGLLWSFAKPVPYSAWVASPVEPSAGYAPFDKTLWPALYAPGLPTPKPGPINGYPAAGPYLAGTASTHSPPNASHGRGVRNRRVLNVPLLECPVTGGNNASANVLAIGRFFMTVPATSTAIYAEFAGIASESTLGGSVELYK